MGRLIDADAFIEDIKTEITNLYMDGLKGTPRPREELYLIIDRINEQPTAYNVDEVVEQLKKRTNDDWFRGTKISGIARDLYKLAMQHAIEIVKEGSMDGKD